MMCKACGMAAVSSSVELTDHYEVTTYNCSYCLVEYMDVNERNPLINNECK